MTFPRVTLTTDRSLAEYGKELLSITDPKGKRFTKIVRQRVIPVLERYGDRLTASMFPEPPERGPGSPRFVWSNDPAANARGRRGFFARFPNGYKRKHRMAKNWSLIIGYKDAQIGMSLSNPTPGSSYVYGAAEYDYRQVPGHIRTGWQNFGVVGAEYMLKLATAANEELSGALAQEAKRV